MNNLIIHYPFFTNHYPLKLLCFRFRFFRIRFCRTFFLLFFLCFFHLFLQKRSRWKDKHPGQWDSSAAGHVNAGDTYAATAPREIREELGVDAEVEEIASLAACAGTGWEFVRLYRARHEGPFRLPPAEIESGAFFTRGQIERWVAARPQDFAPGFLECWRVFQAGGPS